MTFVAALRHDRIEAPSHLSRRDSTCRARAREVFNDLAETPGVEITIKRKSSDLMHLKSYQIDGRLLRTGAANFSASGLKPARQ
jgi:phosphatidylserine/phosphatidylglycerophosphate/cardiolipin synthase-like enzyme